MNCWWVNQNMTWEQEIGGGYMWCPKRNRNGAYNQFFENMRRVAAGDVVFSHYAQRLRYIGIAQCAAITDDRPIKAERFPEERQFDGWLVRVRWKPVPTPLRPACHLEQLRPHLPDRYSPLNPVTGMAYQRYLVHVPKPLAEALGRLIGATDVEQFDRLTD